MQVTICAQSADTREAMAHGLPLCHLAYKVGAEGHLYRSGLGLNVRGGLLALSDSGIDGESVYNPELAAEIRQECNLRGLDGILCDFEGNANELKTRFAYESAKLFKKAGLRFYVPESLASAAPSAKVLINSAVVGGSCEELYRKAVLRYGKSRIALQYEPVCIDFVMPSPRGASDFISPQQLDELRKREQSIPYFSRELCANYFTYHDDSRQNHFVLFDDSRSMLRKLALARECGFGEAFICYPDACGEIESLRDI